MLICLFIIKFIFCPPHYLKQFWVFKLVYIETGFKTYNFSKWRWPNNPCPSVKTMVQYLVILIG